MSFFFFLQSFETNTRVQIIGKRINWVCSLGIQVLKLLLNVVDVELDDVDVGDAEDGRLQNSGWCLQIADDEVWDFSVGTFESGANDRSVGQGDIALLKKYET